MSFLKIETALPGEGGESGEGSGGAAFLRDSAEERVGTSAVNCESGMIRWNRTRLRELPFKLAQHALLWRDGASAPYWMRRSERAALPAKRGIHCHR